MSAAIFLIGFASLLVAFVLTSIVRHVSCTRGLLDVPNERSSHTIPTPRAGGVAILVASMGSFGLLYGLQALDFNLFAALFGGGLAVATVGLIDDRRPLSAGTRLLVHVGAAVWAVAWLGTQPALHLPGPVILSRAVNYLVGVLGIVWVLNLYNFMDGIDGLAVSEAVFISWGGAFLVLLAAESAGVSAAALIFGASCFGFLLWNWPPARIFMGDVGSGYLGFVIAVLAIAATRENPASLWTWIILAGIFIVDATVTLMRRLIRGERVYQAHRSHGYQWLARRWQSHLRVTSLVVIIDLLWLLPCAFLATRFSEFAPYIAALALIPLIALAIAAGSGRSESLSRERSHSES